MNDLVLKVFQLHAILMLSKKVINKNVDILPILLSFTHKFNPCQLTFITIFKTDSLLRPLHPDRYMPQQMSHEIRVQDPPVVDVKDFEDQITLLIKTAVYNVEHER